MITTLGLIYGICMGGIYYFMTKNRDISFAVAMILAAIIAFK